MAEFKPKSDSLWRSTCCNPFQLQHHTARKSLLRPVTKWMCEKNSLIQMGMRICDTCRKKLAKVSKAPDLSLDAEPDSSSSDLASDYEMKYEQSVRGSSVRMINHCLTELGETPVTKIKLQSKKYSERKLEVLTTMMSEVVIGEKQNDESEMLQQLKEKFHSTLQNSAKVQILTILPKSWSIQKIQTEFGVSNFMARKVKQLVKEKGVLSSPDP